MCYHRLIEFLEDERRSAREKTHSPGVGVINVLDIELSKCPDIRIRGYRLFVYTKEAMSSGVSFSLRHSGKGRCISLSDAGSQPIEQYYFRFRF